MRRVLVALVALLVGCHDFDALVGRDGGALPDLQREDLVGADLTGADLTVIDLAIDRDLVGADLTGADLVTPDLATNDGPNVPSDLGGTCPVIDVGDENPLYVRAGTTGGDGSRAKPYGTILAAIGAAQTSGVHHAILIASGNYDETLTINGSMLLFGGWDATFDCAHSGTTTITGTTANQAAVHLASGSVAVLRRLRIVGTKTNATASGGVFIESATGEIFDSVVYSHDVSATVGNATAVVGSRAILNINRSRIFALSATSASAALGVCSSSVYISDSSLDLDNSLAAGSAAIRQDNDCGAMVGGADLTIDRALITAVGNAPVGISVVSDHPVNLAGSVIYAHAVIGVATGLQVESGFEADVVFTQSTMSVPAGYGFAANGAIRIALTDSIVAGDPPFSNGAGAASAVSLDLFGQNIFYSYGSVMIHAVTDLLVVDYAATTNDTMTILEDPGLQADGIHLELLSIAREKASDCVFPVDIDGDPRPGDGSNLCDVGADEWR